MLHNNQLLILLIFSIFTFTCPQVTLAKNTKARVTFNDDLKIIFKGLLDVRLMHTDEPKSFMDNGLGKTRYGGNSSNNKRWLGALSEASLLIMPQLHETLTALIHLKYDENQDHGVDVIESYFDYSPILDSPINFHLRLGAFFPPISLENKSIAWSSRYTITPSAINSWVGEELRTIGAQASISHEGKKSKITLRGALFSANDSAGSLLAWRGWSLNDQKSGLFDSIPLAPVSSFATGGPFTRQGTRVEPFTEVDHSLGVYGAIDWKYFDKIQLQVFQYDSRANTKGFRDGQYAWDTRFTNVGLLLELPYKFRFISQFMDGITLMGPNNVVNVDYWSYYLLLTRKFNKHRFTARFDEFNVNDNDETPLDNNNEHGFSWTAAYAYNIKSNQKIILELLSVKSKREIRTDLGRSQDENELLFQTSYRYSF